MQRHISDVSVIVTREYISGIESTDTSQSPMRKVVFYVLGDTLFVQDIYPSISFFGRDASWETIVKAGAPCEIMSFIEKTITILDSEFANEYLYELSLAYPESEDLIYKAPDKDNNHVDVKNGVIFAWGENEKTFRFLSLQNKDEIRDISLDNDGYATYAMILLYTYILYTYEYLPKLRHTANNIAQTYIDKINNALSDLPSVY